MLELLYSAEPKYADPKAPDTVVNAVPLIYKDGIEPDPQAAKQILSHGHAFIMADMLSSVIYGGQGIQGRFWGTGSRAAAYTGRDDLHGKTGTTNDVHDAWFTGFNANLIATAPCPQLRSPSLQMFIALPTATVFMTMCSQAAAAPA